MPWDALKGLLIHEHSAEEVVMNSGDTVETAVTNLENNEIKVAYFASISSDSGILSIPTGATILLNEFPSGEDAYVNTISGGQPTGNNPTTAGGITIVVTSLDALGNYVLSGVPSAYPVALIYLLKIDAKDWSNLVTANILEYESATDVCLKLDQSAQQTVQGRPKLDDGIEFGTTPTVGSFVEGKVYYDATWKTLSANIDTDVNLQIGQEELRRVYNNTGAIILNGKAVYTTGTYTAGINDVATVGLAKADVYATSQVLGLATQNIPINSYGFINVRGHINDVDTNAWTAGDVLWLSETTAGELTNVAPSSPNLKLRVGRVITKSATVGRINVRIITASRVQDLSDVVITSPLVDDILKYNGLSWINGSGGTVSAGAGVSFFPDDTTITPSGVLSTYPIKTLSPTPVTTAEDVDSISMISNTVLYGTYLYNTALGRTLLDAGIWSFDIYAGVSSATNTTSLTQNINRVRPGTGTLTTTNLTATSKTATASSGTPFVVANVDVGGTIDSDSFLQTPQGYYRILTIVSDIVVTIEVPTTYTNEAGVTYSTHKKLFGITTGEINTVVGAAPYTLSLFTITSVQPSFIVEAADKLATTFFGVSNGTRIVYFSHNGTARYSHVNTPFSTKHNDLSGIFGSSQGYHINSTQYSDIVSKQQVKIIINGNGNPIQTGTIDGMFRFPYTGTITGWYMLEGTDTSTTTAVDIWKDTLANYPPTDADSIVTPSLTATKSNSASGLSIAVVEGDIGRINVDSNNNAKYIEIVLIYSLT